MRLFAEVQIETNAVTCLLAVAIASSAVFGGGAAVAGDITLCRTGVSTATAAGCGAAINSPAGNNLTADGNWYQSSNPGGAFLSQAYVTINSSYPVQTGGPWLANDAASSWITPSNNQAASYNNGVVQFSTSFSVTNPSAANINGRWLADDYGAAIFLNGVTVGQSALPAFGGEGGPFVTFSLTQANANFAAGLNVLTFGVANDSTNHGLLPGGNSPTGLRVEITSATQTALGVPEPASWAMLILGFGGLGAVLRRRREQVARAASAFYFLGYPQFARLSAAPRKSAWVLSAQSN